MPHASILKFLMHASCVALGEKGVLITGPSGSGKSDLVLQLIDQPGYGAGNELIHGKLVADDQTIIERRGHLLIASCPRPIAGLLEIRGHGVVEVDHRADVGLALLVALARSEEIERWPDEEVRMLAGIALPVMHVDPGTATAAARIRARLTAGPLNELRQIRQSG